MDYMQLCVDYVNKLIIREAYRDLQWATKVLRHLAVKWDFLRLENNTTPLHPFPPKQSYWFFYFFDSADKSTYTTLNWGQGVYQKINARCKQNRTSVPMFLKVSQLLLSPIVDCSLSDKFSSSMNSISYIAGKLSPMDKISFCRSVAI